jgi:hypothetical protein
MDKYEEKYYKYKAKYLELLDQVGGFKIGEEFIVEGSNPEQKGKIVAYVKGSDKKDPEFEVEINGEKKVLKKSQMRSLKKKSSLRKALKSVKKVAASAASATASAARSTASYVAEKTPGAIEATKSFASKAADVASKAASATASAARSTASYVVEKTPGAIESAKTAAANLNQKIKDITKSSEKA